MNKQMIWLPLKEKNEVVALHLRTATNEGWKPYTSFPQYSVPDHPIPNGSKGYATYQKLKSQGWDLISTPRRNTF
jgi:hypothetical protein